MRWDDQRYLSHNDVRLMPTGIRALSVNTGCTRSVMLDTLPPSPDEPNVMPDFVVRSSETQFMHQSSFCRPGY